MMIGYRTKELLLLSWGKLVNKGLEKIKWVKRRNYINIDKSAFFELPDVCGCPKKIIMEANTGLYSGSKFIMDSTSEKGVFQLKRGASVAQGLTVVTLEHSIYPPTDKKMAEYRGSGDGDRNIDIIVEEDAWIGTDVTLLPGAHIGRGAIIGAGSVVRSKIPPYAIVIGNPAKVISFAFSPEEVIEYEKNNYAEEDRLEHSLIERNYEKYYTSRLKMIRDFISV